VAIFLSLSVEIKSEILVEKCKKVGIFSIKQYKNLPFFVMKLHFATMP